MDRHVDRHVLDRIVIDRIEPATPSGRFPAKAVVDERVVVSADILADGHDRLAGRLRWRTRGSDRWHVAPLHPVGDDRWQGELVPEDSGLHDIVVEAWRDRFATWRHDVEVRYATGDDVTSELEEGALILDSLAREVRGQDQRRVRDAAAGLRRTSCDVQVRLNAGLDDRVARLLAGVPDRDHRAHLTAAPALLLWVDRPRAGFSAWYELFPRSEGGFPGATKRLAAVAEMRFDVVYLPPIHPIGTTARKGRNNTLTAGPGDPGSPWAIGSAEGGHTALHPELGTMEDFRAFRAEAVDRGMEVALDYALQCSPDHPWVHEHPEWFWRRPDGSIRYAENPPKKYQDIFPINFWPEDDSDRVALWEACRQILIHWIDEGVRIFRVDNPHTKPLAFWVWLIDDIHRDHPDVIFLSEAFTAPKMMAKLAEVGFTQSYTYFTWRNFAAELRAYVEELAYGPTAHYLRPNFWPNTPDILAGPLRDGPPAAFLTRFLLAATLVPNYGIYSGYELYENEPASDENEEYLHSEKYEIKGRDWERADSMAGFITRINEIRRRHPVFRWLRNIRFHETSNDAFLVYSKGGPHAEQHGRDDRGPVGANDLVLVVVNLDPHRPQETVLSLDLPAMGLPSNAPYRAHDELSGETFSWEDAHPYVRLDPTRGRVAHILSFPSGLSSRM
jgi:starch synthase (maltosyl-transferring)